MENKYKINLLSFRFEGHRKSKLLALPLQVHSFPKGIDRPMHAPPPQFSTLIHSL